MTIDGMLGPAWMTRTGEVILVKDLTDSHLRNIIEFLKRGIRNFDSEVLSAWQFSSTLRGEMAQVAIENEIDLLDLKRARRAAWLKVMEAERETRTKGAKAIVWEGE